MATEIKTTSFYLGESNAEFWYDGDKIFSWAYGTIESAIPPALLKRKDELGGETQGWRTSYIENNDKCLLAGTIGPTVSENNSAYDSSRYFIDTTGSSFTPGQYNSNSYPANAKISAIIPIHVPMPQNFGKVTKATLFLSMRQGLDIAKNSDIQAEDYHYLLRRCCYGPNPPIIRSKLVKGSKNTTIQNEAGAISGFKSTQIDLKQSGQTVPAYNAAFQTWPVDLSNFTPGTTYYLHLWGFDLNFSTLVEINLTQSYVVLEYEESVTWVYKNGEKINSVPYVYLDGDWKRLQPYIYKDGQWKRCT